MVTLEGIELKKDNSLKRKGAFLLTTRSGAVWGLAPNDESETNEWMQLLSDCTKESSTAAEFENATTKLFSPAQPEKAPVQNASKPILNVKSTAQPTLKKNG